jgi:hypothetical protein
MDVVVTFALDLEGRVEGDILLRARLDVDFLINKTMHEINDPKNNKLSLVVRSKVLKKSVG